MSDLARHEWSVVNIPMFEGKRLVQQYHYSKSHANTATYLHGIRKAEPWSQIDGCAWWIPPTRSAAEALAGDDWQGVLALSRLVLHPSVPRNGASFLLAGSRRLIDRARWPVLLTYADTRLGHTGGIYKADNWHCDGPVPAGDVWLDDQGRQRGRKRGGRTLTRDEMIALGFHRAPQLPKIRFVHRVPVSTTTPREEK